MKKHNYTIVRRIVLAILLISLLLTSRLKAAKETGTLEFMERHPQLHAICGGFYGVATVSSIYRASEIVQDFFVRRGIKKEVLRPAKGLVLIPYTFAFLYSYDRTARGDNNLIKKLTFNSAMIGVGSLAFFL